MINLLNLIIDIILIIMLLINLKYQFYHKFLDINYKII